MRILTTNESSTFLFPWAHMLLIVLMSILAYGTEIFYESFRV